MDTGLRNKVVVITGGTRGIGYAAAELFLREGACVAVCGSNEKLVAQINARAEQEALPLLAVTADITSAPQLKHLFSEAERRFGRIDVLINNAGMGCPDGFLTLQDDLWAREIDVNLTAVSEACRLVLPYFRKTGSGCILSTSSLCGRIAATVRSIYAVTKAGVNAYTKALALELTPWHVRVNAVAPGMVGTDMVKANHPDPRITALWAAAPCCSAWASRRRSPRPWCFWPRISAAASMVRSLKSPAASAWCRIPPTPGSPELPVPPAGRYKTLISAIGGPLRDMPFCLVISSLHAEAAAGYTGSRFCVPVLF